MSDENSDLLAIRRQNRLAVEQIRAKRLERVMEREDRRRRLEIAMATDWITPYTDILANLRNSDPQTVGPTAAWNRRYGRNYPVFQSEQELAILRAPARVLCATNQYAIGLLEGLTSYVIGSGYTYRAQARNNQDVPDELVDRVQTVIDEFIESNEWYGGEQPGIEEELFWRSCEDGEFFLGHWCDDETGMTTVRTIEPEQVTAKPNSDSREWSFGIRTDPEDVQKPLGYWCFWGDSPTDGEEMSPKSITHFRRNSKRGIKRGMTDFSFGTLDAMNLAGTMLINMSDAAAQQAAIVGIRQHDANTRADIQAFNDDDSEFQTTDPVTGEQINTRRYRRGEWQDIPKGLTYAAGPLASNSPIHIQVLQACLRGAGVRWNAPEWLISGDASNNNYASSLTAESPFVRTVMRRQRQYKSAFLRSMWLAVENWCRARGGIRVGGRLYEWDEVRAVVDLHAEAVSPETRNHLEESQRAAIEIPLGVDSRQRYAQSQGRDWDQVQADNEDYMATTGGDGMPLPLPGIDPTPGGNGNGIYQ